MPYQNIIFEKSGGKAEVILNRPEKLNALSFDTYRELIQAFEEIEKDTEIRVVVLKARGRAFCAGADLADLATTASTMKDFSPEKLGEMMGDAGRLSINAYGAIENCSKPVIAAIHGLAVAGGLELIEACDFAIASEEARLGDQHANFGLVPGGGGTQRLPRLIGIRRAKELLFTGVWISPQEAERIGLVNKVVPADKLGEAVEEMCQKLINKSPTATRIMKKLVNEGMQMDLASGLELEAQAIFEHFRSEDFREGIRAFIEKRKPEFKGK